MKNIKEKHLKRLEGALERVKNALEKAKNLQSIHIITYPLKDVIKDEISFTITDDGMCTGISGAGDLSKGFDKIREGLIDYYELELHFLEEEIKNKKKEIEEDS